MVLLALLLPLLAAAQKNPGRYAAYNAGDKKLVFADSFVDNRNDWLPDEGRCCKWPYIENGFYYRNDTVGFNGYPHAVAFDFTKNFQLDIVAKVTDARKQGVIYWGRDTSVYYDSTRSGWTGFKGSYIYFGKQDIMFKNCDDKYVRNPCHDMTADARRPSGFNKYTVRKVKERYYVFVNELFIRSFSYLPLTGRQLGLGGNENASVIYSKIELNELP